MDPHLVLAAECMHPRLGRIKHEQVVRDVAIMGTRRHAVLYSVEAFARLPCRKANNRRRIEGERPPHHEGR